MTAASHESIDAPAISVVIPVRNRSGIRLDNCLKSLKWQELPEGAMEVLVCDYGSEPEHASSVDKLVAKHDVRLVREQTDAPWNKSIILNIGIQQARGALVMCTDADMVFSADFIAGVLALNERDGAAMVVSRCLDLPESTADAVCDKVGFEAMRAKASVRQTCGTGACQAAPKSFFEEVRGYDQAYKHWGAEDDDMLHRAGRYGLEIRWMPESTAMLHQWHPTLKNTRWLQRRINDYRYKLTRHIVVKNKAGWGRRGALA